MAAALAYIIHLFGQRKNNNNDRKQKATLKLLCLLVPTRPPNGVRVTSFLSTSNLLVQWNPLSQDYANGKLLGYTIYYRETRSEVWWTPDEKVNASSHYPTRFTLKDLKPGHRYRVRVAAFTSKGVGPSPYYYYATTGMILEDILSV